MANSSVMSAQSTVRSQRSSLSGSSKRSKFGTYKTVNRTSVVDESLFGHKKPTNIQPKSDPKCKNLTKSNICSTKPNKELLITNDLIRELIIPRSKMDDVALVLKSSELQKLKGKAQFVSKEDELEREEELRRVREAEAEKSMARRMEMKRIDRLKNQNDLLIDEMEDEAQKNAQSLIQRALQLRNEQEDEIKDINRWIMNAKIQAIRDAQILEKQQIKKEVREENCRLDDMMEVERKNQIAIQEAIDAKKREAELQGAVSILKQMSENAEEKLLEQERLKSEQEAFSRKMEAIMEEEIIKRENRKEKQAKLREELNAANKNIMHKRLENKKHELLLEEKIRKVQQEKADKEAAYEAEQQRIKIEKEKDLARMRSMQERVKDEQSEKDELRAKRAMEASEREWRQKELEAAKKKTETMERMRQEFAAQAAFKKQLMAVQAERDRLEFENILNLQKQLIAKDREEEHKIQATLSKHAAELRRQVEEKEQERIAQRNAFLEEGQRLLEEARLRKIRIQQHKENKLKEFIASGLPNKYLQMVQERVKPDPK